MMARSELSDRQAITDLIYRYCRSVDRLDIPLGRSIWHEDSFADYGVDYYQGPGEKVIDLICQHHLSMLSHSHQVTNIIIDLDGNQAGSESYCIATLRMANEGKLMQMTIWARYIDRWSCRNGLWGIDSRIAVRDFDEIRAVTPMSQTSASRRDTSDPSYGVLRAKNII